MSRIGVMQLIDTLDAGGAERVAVNLANLLPREHYRSYLCTTRREGLLAGLIAPDVDRLRLERRRRFDVNGLRQLVAFIRANQVRILHAHGTSLFVAAAASLLPPHPAVVWHDHYGRHGIEERPAWIYRLLARRAGAVIAVNQPLAEWSRCRLRVPADRVRYIPNFVCEEPPAGAPPELPGHPGARIVCVANLRPQKDHPTLLRSMALVSRRAPAAHLLLVGALTDPAYREAVRGEVERLGLAGNVSLLGQRLDVPAVLRACDIGVLSSASEGLPLALIEYGMAGLPAVATRVGQCPEVLDEGQAGILVPPGQPDRLAEALLHLLESPAQRADLGARLRRRVRLLHGAEAVMGQICAVYDLVLGPDAVPAAGLAAEPIAVAGGDP